jgi:GTP-binding protein Era
MSEFRSGFVSLVGRPNSGKSTLLNRMVGRKVSITSSNPQTTRNRIQGIRTMPEYQIIFIDTPGIHKPLHLMNERMARMSVSALSGVDIVALLIDVSTPFGSGDAFVLRMIEHVDSPVFLLINKVDLVAKEAILPVIDAYRQKREFAEIVPVSALKGEGCDLFESLVADRLPEGPPYFPDGTVTDIQEKFLAQEIIREKVLAHTRDEIPYTVGVCIVRFQKNPGGGILGIEARIYVEKESQKPIVIGKNGSLLKKMGSEARLDLESIFQTRIFLELHVKTKENWREDPRLLNEMGVQ